MHNNLFFLHSFNKTCLQQIEINFWKTVIQNTFIQKQSKTVALLMLVNIVLLFKTKVYLVLILVFVESLLKTFFMICRNLLTKLKKNKVKTIVERL